MEKIKILLNILLVTSVIGLADRIKHFKEYYSLLS